MLHLAMQYAAATRHARAEEVLTGTMSPCARLLIVTISEQSPLAMTTMNNHLILQACMMVPYYKNCQSQGITNQDSAISVSIPLSGSVCVMGNCRVACIARTPQ